MKISSRYLFHDGFCALFACITLLFLPGRSWALIPEPDNVLYGTITLDNLPVTASRTDVVIEARRQANSPAVASYRMGSDPALGNYYALSVPVESLAPLTDTNASQLADDLVIVVLDTTGVRAQTSYTVAERGTVQRVDFGAAAADSDGDGLPDAWELQYFSNLNQFPSSVNSNGMTTLQNFIAGTDPNDPSSAFRLAVARTNAQDHVLFQARRTEGPGYTGMTRIYSLESTPSLANPAWTGVSGYTNLVGNNQLVDFLPPAGSSDGFLRARISLQGFTAPP